MSKALTRRTSILAPQLDYIIVDGSSSMQSKWWDTLAALDGFMDTLKAQNIHSHGIALTFDDTDLQCIQRDSLISEWKTFSDDPLGAHFGSTPLYDAINMMARHLKDLDPTNCSIVICTDGEENASRHTSLPEARALLDWCRAKGWQVTFLGADFDNNRQAKALGATASNSIGVRREKLAEAGRLLGMKRANNARSGEDINFSEDEKQKFGGYLTHG